jgi:uncharacterized membrane protein YqjE
MADLDLLGLLPRAAPLVLRHLGAYAELIAEDIADAQRRFAERLIATALLIVCCAIALVMACITVIALTWDTPYRVQSVAWMLGVFVVVALIAAVYRSRVVAAPATFLPSVRREWREDRDVLDRILHSEPGEMGREPG